MLLQEDLKLVLQTLLILIDILREMANMATTAFKIVKDSNQTSLKYAEVKPSGKFIDKKFYSIQKAQKFKIV